MKIKNQQASKFNDLPTRDFFHKIIEAVDQNQVTILTAETGAGKSTQVPQYLAESGYSRIIVTQPRILAARNLARRVREEWALRNSEDSSQLIGYRTAHERDDSGQTKILYCTDGLQLVRELTGAGTGQQQILVLDEVHEWNENMEVLVAWAKRRAEQDPRFKVLIMSATLDQVSLAQYFATDSVINVPGRYFEVKKRSGQDLVQEIFHQLENPGHNVLVFLPGKSEIQAVQDAIQAAADKKQVPIIPLHAQLESEMQQRAFASYDNGKIILATNIAQTSVTIDDIDLVIDSGLVRQTEVRSGVEGLFIAQAAQADCNQRAGRAGRTRPGEYILASFDNFDCPSIDQRAAYAVPEIKRTLIDRLTLRLANIGIDIEDLDFYHQPSRSAIKRAKQTLLALGALTKNGQITKIGRSMERFPVESRSGRMLVEAANYPKELQAKLATIIAIQEVGGIVKGGANYLGWQTYTKQTKSDLLAQYDVYLALERILPEMFEMMGIIAKNVSKVDEIIERLNLELNLNVSRLEPIDHHEEFLLRRAVVAGQVDQFWLQNQAGHYEHLFNHQTRELSASSVVKNARLLAGMPFDLQVPGYGGESKTLHLLQNVTVLDATWLAELLPQKVKLQNQKIYYDPRLGGLAKSLKVKLGRTIFYANPEIIKDNSIANQKLFERQFALWAYSKLKHELRFVARTSRVPKVNLNQVEHYVKSLKVAVINLAQLDSQSKQKLLAAAHPETYFDKDFWRAVTQRTGSTRGHKAPKARFSRSKKWRR